MKKLVFLTCVLWLAMGATTSRANAVYPLEIFTTEGQYYDSPDLNLYVEVSGADPGQAVFSFYNESSINSAIAQIYFDATSLLGSVYVAEGPGTSFKQPAVPKNLPGAKLLDPPFEASDELSIGANAPPPKDGINPGEWLRFTFELENNGTFEDVIDELNTGTIRIGVHVIGLPDGSSGSAVAVPEPATIILLGCGVAWIVIRKKRFV